MSDNLKQIKKRQEYEKILSAALAAIILSTGTSEVQACTNMLVGKKASVNGATMISYNADSHTLYGELYFTPAADHQPGAMRQVFEWDTNKPLGAILSQHTPIVS